MDCFALPSFHDGSASRVWAAKAAFLFGSAALYLGYLVLVESAILAAAALLRLVGFGGDGYRLAIEAVAAEIG